MWHECFKMCCCCFQGLTFEQTPDKDSASSSTGYPPSGAILRINFPGKNDILENINQNYSCLANSKICSACIIFQMKISEFS